MTTCVLQLLDRLFEVCREVVRDRSVWKLAGYVSGTVTMRISMSCDHAMTNGISDVADPLQMLRYRAPIQAILKPAPPKEKMSDESHQALEIRHRRQCSLLGPLAVKNVWF